jgi:ABC-type transport system involved in multi-copper enzyme maturation permease subunit
MRTIAHSLAWKEFREHRWDALATLAVVLAMPLFYAVRDPEVIRFLVGVELAVYPFLAGIFFGMRIAASERTSRTAAFLCALPVRPPVLGLAKVAAASIAVLLPLVLLVALNELIERWLETPSPEGALGWVHYLTFSLATLAAMFVVALSGAAARSEARVATQGMLALVVLLITLTLAMSLAERHIPLVRDALLDPPGNWPPEIFGFVVLVAMLAVVTPILAVLCVAGYDRSIRPLTEQRRGWLDVRGYSPARLTSPLAALAWKDLREIAAMCAQVLAGSLLLSLLVSVLAAPPQHVNVLHVGMQVLAFALWLGGFVLAILIGVGTVAADLAPPVNIFWRSRPISASAWYWTKYVLGMLAIVATIALPTLVMLPYTQGTDVTGKGWSWSLLLWALAFSLALTMTCLFRQALRASILTIGAVAILYAAVQACYGSFSSWGEGAPLGVLIAVFTVALVASTIVGWWVAVRDAALFQ